MKEDTWVGVLAIGVFFSFIVILMRLIAISSRKNYENLRNLAERLGLGIGDPKPVMGFYSTTDVTGEIRGKRVRLYNYTTGTSKSKTTWSAISVAPLKNGGLTFSISRQGFGSRVKALFGVDEIKVGDEAFDREWFIQTNAPDFLAAGLLPELQRKIQTHDGKWKLEEGEVIYSEKGSFSDRERCERFIAIADAACDLADVAEVYAKQSS
jgi:hypothetical protein